ncbi:MAG: biosynthetic arginine decarboxylase [Bacteriovoracaceae bacterium]|nr:biosynthetic arginine decarboxylase [Bacteriovoracaceae bacterium]
MANQVTASEPSKDRKNSQLELKEKQLHEKSPDKWGVSDSKKLFLIQKWGDGFFDINEKGSVCVKPLKNAPKGPCIVLQDILDEVKAAGISLPLVIRFHDILRARVVEINKTFHNQISEANYRGEYFGVYPVKVNQMREVVEEIVDAGAPFRYGLEAGSKPELLAVLSMPITTGALTVLNGYKDAEYLKLAMLGIRMGRPMVVVVEKFSELPLLLKIADEMKVEPIIGMRAKLQSRGSGKWAASTGDRAKFGLTITEIVQAIDLLKSHQKLHWLKLFHFHIGSQIPDIKTFKEAITEGARIFCKMTKMGVPLEYFDVGGGVGINYEGGHNNTELSVNYGLKDYAMDVVYIVKQICDLEDVNHPHLVSESGRAITAYHSCIITDVFGSVAYLENQSFSTEKKTGEHIIVTNMRDLFHDLQAHNIRQTYNDALSVKEESISAFKLGVLDLEERAKVETMFLQTIKKIIEIEKDTEEKSVDTEALTAAYSQQYLCNFSVFQSTPDTWGIGQILPIMPINRLCEKPTIKASMADITCDSDGKIDNFISFSGIKKTTWFHSLNNSPSNPNNKDTQGQALQSENPYYVGIFLTGAYQDIMGDNHNLFGRLNEVHVYCDDDDPNDFYVEEFIRGHSAQQVLSTLQYSPEAMAKNVKSIIDAQVRRGKIRPREGVELCDFYEQSLAGYTYLKHD